MVSVVLYGRNDSHGYNLHRRAALSLNCIAEVLTDPDDEIVFVDYNTPRELPTFVEALADTLTHKARGLIRVLRVPVEIHDARFGERTHLPALEPLARNVAVRRSNPANRWILSTNTDMIFVPRAKQSLSEVVARLEDGFYQLPRYEVPEWLWERFDRGRPAEAIDALGRLGPRLRLDEPTHSYDWIRFDAPGDFQLVRRDDLVAIDCFDEEMILGYHVDSNLCRRLLLRLGEIRSLEEELSAYHCNHTRVPTVFHGSGPRNDLDRYFYGVTAAALPRQRDQWGLPDVELEEIRLTKPWLERPTEALLTATAAPVAPVQPSNAATREYRITYESAHVLPFVADALVVSPKTARVGYLGANPVLQSLLSRLVEELGFSHPLASLTVEGGKGSGAFAPTFPHADLVVVDLGLDRSIAADPPAAALPSELARVFETLAAAVEAERRSGTRTTRRLVIVNGSTSNLWEPYVRTNFACSHTTVHSRVEHAYVRDDVDPSLAAESVEQTRWRVRWLESRSAERVPLRLEPGTPVDVRMLESYAGFDDAWLPPEPHGMWAQGEHSSILLEVGGVDAPELLLQVFVNGVCARPGESVLASLDVNGHVLDRRLLTADEPERVWYVEIPASLAADGRIELRFRFENPRSPAEVGWSPDARPLGLRLAGLSVHALPAARRYALGQRLDFSDADASSAHHVGAWTRADGWGIWTNGEPAGLELVLDPLPTGDMDLVAVAGALVADRHPLQEVRLLGNGQSLGTWRFDADRTEGVRRTPIPRELVARDGALRVEFHAPGARSPEELGLNSDRRRLGLHLRSLQLVEVDRNVPVGATLDFTDPQVAQRHLVDGWSWPEPTGVWTDGKRASIALRLEDQPDGDLALVMRASALVGRAHPEQTVDVWVNGHASGTWVFDTRHPRGDRTASLPQSVIRDGTVELVLAMAKPVTPLDLGLSGDRRSLGIHVQTLRISRHEACRPPRRAVTGAQRVLRSHWF